MNQIQKNSIFRSLQPSHCSKLRRTRFKYYTYQTRKDAHIYKGGSERQREGQNERDRKRETERDARIHMLTGRETEIEQKERGIDTHACTHRETHRDLEKRTLTHIYARERCTHIYTRPGQPVEVSRLVVNNVGRTELIRA